MSATGTRDRGSNVSRLLAGAWRRLMGGATARQGPVVRRRSGAYAPPCIALRNGQLLLPGIAEPHRWDFRDAARAAPPRRSPMVEATAA